MGGRKVAIQRPRVRTATDEVALPTFEAMAATDPLDRPQRRHGARHNHDSPRRTVPRVGWHNHR